MPHGVSRDPDGTPHVTIDADDPSDWTANPDIEDAVADVVRSAMGGAAQLNGYALNDEVRDIARRLIEQEPRFARLADERIGYAMLHGKKPEGKGGIHLLAKVAKAPALWRDLGRYDAVLWANGMAWAVLTDLKREALIAHELCHLGVNEKGQLDLYDHDVEEFAWVVRRYGQWHIGLEQFAEQLGMFTPQAPAVAAKAGG